MINVSLTQKPPAHLLSRQARYGMPSLVIVVLAMTALLGVANADVRQAAQQAEDDGLSSAAAVSALLGSGFDPARATRAVSDVYNDCEATYAAIQTAVTARPGAATSIVTAIASQVDCACARRTVWGQVRLEQRLRPASALRLVEVQPLCACSATAVEAAVGAAPEAAPDILEAAVNAQQRSAATVDALGQIGGALAADANRLVRQPQVCEGDRIDDDEFRSRDEWQVANDDRIGDLGSHQTECEGEATDLLISQYLSSDGIDVVELYNGTDELIDLAQARYQLALYYDLEDRAGQTVALQGVVGAGDTFVLRSPRTTGLDADQSAAGLATRGANAVVLRRGLSDVDCACAEATMAASLRGVAGEGQASDVTPAQDELLRRLSRRYGDGDGNVGGVVVDALGEIGEPRDQAWGEGETSTADNVLRRRANICRGDENELDEFLPAAEWQGFAANTLYGLGQHEISAGSCALASDDLIISEYVEGEDENRAVELFNGTNQPIDLDRGDYVLEIYADGADDPTEVIDLAGVIEADTTFLLTHPDADNALVNLADQTTRELDFDGTDAIVLRRIRIASNQVCRADFVVWEPGTIAFIPPFEINPVRPPLTSDSNIRDPFGGDVSSPE